MRLNKRLSICVGISLVMLAGIVKVQGGDINAEDSNQSIKSALIKEVKYEVIDKIDKPDDEDNSFQKAYSIEEFIKFSMLNYNSINKEEQEIFAHLNFQKIVNSNELFSIKESLADYSARIVKVKQMQKLAIYIKDNYDIPLKHSEEIVLSSFVEAKKKNLEPMLVLSLIGVESTFKQYSKSGAGAVGLTQVIPKYHQEKIAKLRNMDMWSISGNISVGTDVLREYLDLSKGNVRSALQRYNGSLGDSKLRYSNKVFAKMNKLNNALEAS